MIDFLGVFGKHRLASRNSFSILSDSNIETAKLTCGYWILTLKPVKKYTYLGENMTLWPLCKLRIRNLNTLIL